MSSQTQGLSQGGLSELKQRLLFVLLGVFIFRVGSYIPVPGLDPHRMQDFFNQHGQGLLGMFNMFTGGALRRLTIFALGVMPYISASIIMQMMTMVMPSFIELKKEGENGRKKINQYTRYFTVLLSLVQALGITKWLATSGVALNPDLTFYFVATVTLVTGTMFLMWLGEQMTERGIGNGISLIIFAGIVARLPSAVAGVFTQVREGQMSMLSLLVILFMVIAVVAVVVYFERAQRKIRINYAKRQMGRKMYGGQSSHLPLKINMAGVIPPIFAQSILLFPLTIAHFFSTTKGFGWLDNVATSLSPGQPVYMIVFAAAIIFFSFFYTALVFNPKETADNLKKSGAYIAGIRPGEQTTNFIDKVMTRLTLVGAIYLCLVALLPQVLRYVWDVPFTFGGTSLLIVVVVVMDFMSQVQAHLMSHQYESLMRGKGSGNKSSRMKLL